MEEMATLHKNKTWKLVARQPQHKVVKFKWLYKLKKTLKQGDKPTYKARLVAKGFNQRGVDYNEVFSSVVKHTSIRIMMTIMTRKDLELQQMNVKTVFLHGDLDEVIHMEQPEGFQSSNKGKCCLLMRSIYSLKQSSRQ